MSPVEAFAAATALGFSFTAQMAGIVFGAWLGAAQGGPKLEETPGEAPETESAARGPGEAPMAGDPQTPVAVEPVVAKVKAPARRRKTAVADDLKRIAGIGPKAETRLAGMGVRSFAQVAAWSEEEAARIDAALGTDGRIGRDDWVGQAKTLSRGGKG